jgi:hypothetical protein
LIGEKKAKQQGSRQQQQVEQESCAEVLDEQL